MIMRFFILCSICLVVSAYRTETFFVDETPSGIDISSACSLFTNENGTTLRFHSDNQKIHSSRSSSVRALNEDCSTVLFGYPDENKVILWRPFESTESTILPNFNVQVHRFGFSLDIQNQTWVVGAPGRPNNRTGLGATMGYAFVYEGETLHSCRSLYDTYCYSSTCEKGFQQMKFFYNLTDYTVPYFQTQCQAPQQPRYSRGILDPNLIPNFVFQGFGYSVAITGQIGQLGASLYISAPGDVNRFMEDNDGKNYGRIYAWDSVLWNSMITHETITWWEMSMTAPIEPVNLPGVTYRAFGRDIAASKSALAVASYPLEDEPNEPFIMVYDCDPYCEESPERGIALNDLPGNVLGYLTNAERSYTDGKTGWSYIPSDIDGDSLSDFQNEFIGQKIGIVGSNIVFPDPHQPNVYRFGKDSKLREIHSYLGQTNFGTNTQHWIHDNGDFTYTHLWNCVPGQVGMKDQCTPCGISYFSDDGWLAECTRCPKNFTTNQTGQTECQPWYPPTPPGMTWVDTVFVMGVIVMSVAVMFGLCVACQFCSSPRKKRVFHDRIDV